MKNLFTYNDGQTTSVIDIDPLSGRANLIDIGQQPVSTTNESEELFMAKNNEQFIVCEQGVQAQDACNLMTKEGYNVLNVNSGIEYLAESYTMLV